jgi:hypothetical protein
MVTALNMTLPRLISTMVRNGVYCLSCNKRLTTADFRSPITNHDTVGSKHVTTTDIKLPMWVFGRCSACEYQTALWKMVKSLS